MNMSINQIHAPGEAESNPQSLKTLSPALLLLIGYFAASPASMSWKALFAIPASKPTVALKSCRNPTCTKPSWQQRCRLPVLLISACNTERRPTCRQSDIG